MEFPPLEGKPSKEFFEKIAQVSESLGVIILPSF
jgi:hypothetical protein